MFFFCCACCVEYNDLNVVVVTVWYRLQDSIVSKVSTSLLSLTKPEMDGLVVAARMLHVDEYG